MKKIFLLLVLAVGICALIAQSAKEEAIQTLDSAKKLIQQDNYVKAQDEINYALSKVMEILAEQLLKYIPAPPAGYQLTDKNTVNMGQLGGLFGSANAIAAKGSYSNDKEATVDLTISAGGILGKSAGFAALAQMYGGSPAGSKTIRIGGYNGTTEYQADSRCGKLTMQVGEKISIIVEGNNIDNADVLKTFVEKIELGKLEKAF